ncbi:ABC transporter ATP-binding protein [Dehalococcoidia bacterium]|nr:ABC transporter ATP-binding protein [Dehalococcoidia bacterium]MCL0088622.1 ABC transporter ATP-binding protein [Dehalococcoidia bacterium]
MPEILLEIENVQKRYGRKPVLRGVSFSVGAGEVVGIVGENGAGKSTLLQIIVGLLPSDGGQVMVRGGMGYCPQDPVTFDLLTVHENLAYFGTAYGLTDSHLARHAATLLEQLDCAQYAEHRVAELSGGTRQKLNLIIALLYDPDVLLLDEPYQGFDYATYLSFWELSHALRARGKAIVVISHMVTERQHFDKIIHLEGGYVRVEQL